MIKLSQVIIISFALATPLPALSLEIPAGGEYDHRIRFIDYNPADVVKLVGHYGYSTHIQFSKGEKVNQIAMGDPNAWAVRTEENHIFIKPTGDNATTNMTVITTLRVYNFDLSAHWSKRKSQSHDMYFQINFNYPEHEKKLSQQRLTHEKATLEVKKIKTGLDKMSNPKNWNYWSKGGQEITPIKAYDDGRFTYLTFGDGKEMPAIYSVDSTGKEHLVNTNIDPNQNNTIIVHKVASKLILRKGSAVACIFNKSLSSKGVANDTGTTSPVITRKIKGLGQ